MLTGCTSKQSLEVTVYETSVNGNKLAEISEFETSENPSKIQLKPEVTFQTITGFGGSFTESSAYLLNRLSKKNRDMILNAYFSEDGANYTLTRTHISSCDFSLNNYTYAPIADDMELKHFSIEEDKDDLIPMIKDAMEKLVHACEISILQPRIETADDVTEKLLSLKRIANSKSK